MGEEQTDFAFPKEPLPGGILPHHTILTMDEQVKSSKEKEPVLAKNMDVPAELTKTYHFGCGPCHPHCLQWLFARKKVFTFLLCCYAFLQGAIVSGFTSVILSTIQKRYNFNSAAAGFVAVSYDASVTVTVIFISYFGGKSHKPRWLGISLLVLSLGCFIFALPQFLFGEYGKGSLSSLYEGCQDNRTFVEDCSSSDIAAYSMFVIGNVFIAVGAAPLFTVGQAYLDEIVLPRYLSVHIGVYHAMSVLGPALGYAVGSSLLSVYVDPWAQTTLSTDDPAWVGAWWLSFILGGIMAILLAIPFLMFPRYLPDSAQVRKERAKEMAKIYPSQYANEDSLTITVKMFPVHMKRLLLNPSFMFASFGIATLFFMISGLVSFAPKYFETQFKLTATFAGLLGGGIGITSATIGVLLGALILFLTKMSGRAVILFVTVIIAVTVLANPAFLLHCPQADIVGVTYGSSGIDTASCARECECMSHTYEPVCGQDGLTYFSPCRAGCTSTVIDGSYSFTNCSCVSGYLNTTMASATDGICESDCIALAPFVVILLVVFFLVFVTQIPFNYFTMRVVADDQRSLALGVQSAIWRVFGTVPGPLVFGALFDVACLQWQDPCEGDRGNCWIYDNTKLSIYAMSFGIPCILIAAVLFFLSWLTYPKDRREGEEKEAKTKSEKKKRTRSVVSPVTRQRPSSIGLMSRQYHASESEDALLNGTSPNVVSTPSDDLHDKTKLPSLSNTAM